MASSAENDRQEKLKLIEIVKQALQRDLELREQYGIGEKFRFVRDRLNTLLATLEKGLPAEGSLQSKRDILAEDEKLVYVYLYNTQGIQVRTWQTLVNPKVFYEYSVNRPIYDEKHNIEALLKSKTNKAQHGYLTVAVKQNCILKSANEHKDLLGNPVVKIKEGSLHYDRVMSFTHQDIEYTVQEDGSLVKKN